MADVNIDLDMGGNEPMMGDNDPFIGGRDQRRNSGTVSRNTSLELANVAATPVNIRSVPSSTTPSNRERVFPPVVAQRSSNLPIVETVLPTHMRIVPPSSVVDSSRESVSRRPAVVPIQHVIHHVAMTSGRNYETASQPQSSSSSVDHKQDLDNLVIQTEQGTKRKRAVDAEFPHGGNIAGGASAASDDVIVVADINNFTQHLTDFNAAHPNGSIGKRLRNNEASRKSKAKSKRKDELMAQRVVELEIENHDLRRRIAAQEAREARNLSEQNRLLELQQQVAARETHEARAQAQRDNFQH